MQLNVRLTSLIDRDVQQARPPPRSDVTIPGTLARHVTIGREKRSLRALQSTRRRVQMVDCRDPHRLGSDLRFSLACLFLGFVRISRRDGEIKLQRRDLIVQQTNKK